MHTLLSSNKPEVVYSRISNAFTRYIGLILDKMSSDNHSGKVACITGYF